MNASPERRSTAEPGHDALHRKDLIGVEVDIALKAAELIARSRALDHRLIGANLDPRGARGQLRS